jgi:cold shock CspA family protein
MLTGTISDFDTDGLFGLIAADDGRLMIFNLRGVTPPLRDQFRVGARVEFVEQKGSLAPRAAALVSVVAQ